MRDLYLYEDCDVLKNLLDGNVGVSEKSIVSVPLYMAMFI